MFEMPLKMMNMARGGGHSGNNRNGSQGIVEVAMKDNGGIWRDGMKWVHIVGCQGGFIL